MPTDFDWSEPEPEDQLTRTTHSVVAYLNPYGDIVIRQEVSGYGEEAQIVILPIDACNRLVSRLQKLLERTSGH